MAMDNLGCFIRVWKELLVVAHVQESGVTPGGNRKSVAGMALENLSKETALYLLCWEGKS